MQQRRWGRIITITSEAGLWGNLGQANYGSAKAGIVGFTRTVAREMGPHGVTANAVAPRAWTRMTRGVPPAGGQALATTLQDFERWKEWTPEDVAPLVAFLASDGASHVNGQVFLVYGNNVVLLAQPRLVRAILNPEGWWGVEELRHVLPQTLVKDLPNPAPAQHRPQTGTAPTAGP
jgi:short-subunit dehydrogenase